MVSVFSFFILFYFIFFFWVGIIFLDRLKYFDACRGVIFVIDSADKERVGEARQEFHKLFQVFFCLFCLLFVCLFVCSIIIFLSLFIF